MGACHKKWLWHDDGGALRRSAGGRASRSGVRCQPPLTYSLSIRLHDADIQPHAKRIGPKACARRRTSCAPTVVCSATPPRWQKALEFGISRCPSLVRGSEVLAKHLVREGHASTFRTVCPKGAGEPSEFDAILPFGAASAVSASAWSWLIRLHDAGRSLGRTRSFHGEASSGSLDKLRASVRVNGDLTADSGEAKRIGSRCSAAAYIGKDD